MWYPGSGVVLDCINSRSLSLFLLLQQEFNSLSNKRKPCIKFFNEIAQSVPAMTIYGKANHKTLMTQ